MIGAEPSEGTCEVEAGAHALRARLGKVRRKLWWVVCLTGLLYFVVCLLGFHVGTLVLDRTLELPRLFRAVVLLVTLCALVVLLVRRLFRPARDAAALSDDEAALYVERRFGLEEVLISAVQLARRPGGDGPHGAPVLIRCVVEKAVEQLERIDVREAVSSQRLLRLFGLAAAATAVVGVLVVTRPASAKIWWERNVLLSETPWPREVQIDVFFPPGRGGA